MEKIKDKRIVVLGLAIICLGLIVAIIITSATGTHGGKQAAYTTDEKIFEKSDVSVRKDIVTTETIVNTTIATTKEPKTTMKAEVTEKTIVPGSLATLSERQKMIKAIEVFFYMCVHIDSIDNTSIYDYNTKLTIDGKEYCLIKNWNSISTYRKELSKYLDDGVIDKYWFSKDYLKEYNGELYVLIGCLTNVGQHVGIDIELPNEKTSVSATYDGLFSISGKWNMYGYVYFTERYEVEFDYVNGTLKMVNVVDYGPIAGLRDGLRPE